MFCISKYKSSISTTVENYFERFDWALQLSKIADDKHHHYAHVHMEAELNSALKVIVSPQAPEDLTYAQIKKTLVSHFDQVKNKYAESIKFRRIVQGKNETVASFALRLRQGVMHCDYDNFIDKLLTEQLHGLDSRDICDEIIAKKLETFTAAYEIAHSLEATSNTTVEVKTSGLTSVLETTNKLDYAPSQVKRNRKGNRGSSPPDRRQRQEAESAKNWQDDQLLNCDSGGGRHSRTCKFFNAECHSCGKKGHISRVYRFKTSQIMEQDTKTPQPTETINSVQYFHGISEANSIKPSDRRMLAVQIDRQNLKMELNTGASCDHVSIKTLRIFKLILKNLIFAYKKRTDNS